MLTLLHEPALPDSCGATLCHAVDKIAIDMPAAPIRLQSAMCYLLTALAAFNQDSHARISAAGLIPQLVSICRQSCRLWVMVRRAAHSRFTQLAQANRRNERKLFSPSSGA